MRHSLMLIGLSALSLSACNTRPTNSTAKDINGSERLYTLKANIGFASPENEQLAQLFGGPACLFRALGPDGSTIYAVVFACSNAQPTSDGQGTFVSESNAFVLNTVSQGDPNSVDEDASEQYCYKGYQVGQFTLPGIEGRERASLHFCSGPFADACDFGLANNKVTLTLKSGAIACDLRDPIAPSAQAIPRASQPISTPQ